MRTSVKRSNLYGDGVENFCSIIQQIATSINKLSKIVNPNADEYSEEFKRKQLYHLLNGDLLDIKKIKTSEITKQLIEYSSPVESHLAILNLKDIGCNHQKLTDQSQVSVLEVHNRSTGWCSDCVNSTSAHTPKFKSGIINPFVCWRRGQRSGNLGFVHHSKLNLIGGKVTLNSEQIFSNPLLQSMIYNLYPKLNVELGERIIGLGTSMVSVIMMNSDTEHIFNRKNELSSMLRPQNLVSRHINTTNIESTESSDVSKKTMLEVLEKLLDKLQAIWKLHGISKDSCGIIGIALINNGSKYAEKSPLPDLLSKFSNENSSWYQKYDLDKLPSTLKEGLGLSPNSVPEGCAALCIIFDSIVDLGGI